MGEDGNRSECAECGRKSEHDDGVWHPGEFCLFGTLFVCSLACAEKFASTCAPGCRPGEPGFVCVEPAIDPRRDLRITPEKERTDG